MLKNVNHSTLTLDIFNNRLGTVRLVVEQCMYKFVEQKLRINLIYFCIVPSKTKIDIIHNYAIIFEKIMNIRGNCEQAISGT